MAYLFGPVYSERLGRSLGVDIVPYKICNFDCVYCECGKTNAKTERRGSFINIEDLKKELDRYLSEHSEKEFDVVTITGSGEPTLEIHLVKIIQEIRKKITKPIAILTNSSLINEPDIQDVLGQLDLVLPSLDAVSPEVFQKIDQPVPGKKVEDIISGMIDFRKKYPHVKFWLEVLFVEGVNDDAQEIEKMKKVIERIKPDQVNIVTVSRPPAYLDVKAISKKRIEEIKKVLWPYPTVFFQKTEKRGILSAKESGKALEEKIIETIKRRPCSYQDLENLFELNSQSLKDILTPLIESKLFKSVQYEGKEFIAYRPKKGC